MLGRLGKDLYSVQQRIFDHRAFLAGEINYFLDNFELKRNETEVQSLFKVTEVAGELKYELCNRCSSLATANLSDISKEVKTLLQEVESFNSETQVERIRSDSLAQTRSKREQRKAEFLADLEHRYNRVENSFEEKEEEISELYSDLQVKLNIPK